MTRPVVVIGGPTASGKSGLALAVAEAFAGTVINADSMQVYRELRVLTARPGADARARAPHRLYGVRPAARACSAALWRAMAVGEIAAAEAAGRLPVVVGGTGLYLAALMDGLAPVPEIPAVARAEARALHARLGGAAFHAALRARDPVGAARLHPGDTQRLIRAYEVVTATGRPLAEWQADGRDAPAGGEAVARGYLPIVLAPPRATLHAACDARFVSMVEGGALDEVAALVALGLDPRLPAMKALGVPELSAHLRGELDLAEAVRSAQGATRRYAKRQATWFRHQLPAARVFSAQFSKSLLPEIFSNIRCFLLTCNR